MPSVCFGFISSASSCVAVSFFCFTDISFPCKSKHDAWELTSNSFFLPALDRKISEKDSSCHSISHVYISGPVISVTSPGHILITVVQEWSLLPEKWRKNILVKDFPTVTKKIVIMDNEYIAVEKLCLFCYLTIGGGGGVNDSNNQ